MSLPFGPSYHGGGTEVTMPNDTSIKYMTTKEFYLAPFFFLPRDRYFYYEPENQRAVYLSCGYYAGDDIEATISQDDIDKLINDGWIYRMCAKEGPKYKCCYFRVNHFGICSFDY